MGRLTAHGPHGAPALSDRVVAIHDGHVVEAGAPEKLDRARLGLLMAGRAA